MKDYYKILEIPENASGQDIKSAFRKLAFKYHPDKNPGNEKAAEAKFKEINEAFAVLGDENKRQQYDLARKGQYTGAGTGSGGFNFSQEDIFNGAFNNQAFYEEISRMFGQAGLRFDRNFYNQNFSNGNTVFRFYTNAGDINNQNYSGANANNIYKPGFMERMVSKVLNKITRFMLKQLFGVEYKQNLDIQAELEIIPEEALSGAEKEITYKRGTRLKKLMVKIPGGIETETKIRLKGMGLAEKGQSGDLIIHVKVREQSTLNSG
jgi:DnaJ-class molecular chaperone